VVAAADCDIIWNTGSVHPSLRATDSSKHVCAGWAGVWSQVFGDDVVAQLPGLQLVVRMGSGFENIPVDACTAAGVVVCNTPRANISPVSEHAVALLLAAARQIPVIDRAIHDGSWATDGKWWAREPPHPGAWERPHAQSVSSDPWTEQTRVTANSASSRGWRARRSCRNVGLVDRSCNVRGAGRPFLQQPAATTDGAVLGLVGFGQVRAAAHAAARARRPRP
jgi:lactate dehydrogenase-like 2-hydroxyacid dehydrogenase